MSSEIRESRIYLLIRVLLGILFLWASWEKILHPEGFAVAVRNYALLPEVLIHPVALLLPWVEAFCGVMLITGRLVKGSAFIVDILMVIFILAFIINLYRGVDISCGCFSVAETAPPGNYFYYLTRDFIILAAGIWLLWYDIRKSAQEYQQTLS